MGDSRKVEETQLNRIISLLKKSATSADLQQPGSLLNGEVSKDQTDETLGELLEWFSRHYDKERKFKVHIHNSLFIKTLQQILKPTRFNSPENTLRIVICLRMLMRDPFYQEIFVQNQNFVYFAEIFQVKCHSYLTCMEESYVIDVVANFSSIYEKLSRCQKFHSALLQASIHRSMLFLLSAGDTFILHCALHVLVALAESTELRRLIADHHSIEWIIQIIHEFDDISKSYAASLLRVLCADEELCEQVMIYDALPVLLSVLNDCEQCDLLWHVVWTLVRLCSDTGRSDEIRLLGGIPLILSLLNSDRELTCSRHELCSGYTRRLPTGVSSRLNKEELTENKLKLLSACCAVLTELALDDRCTQTIVQTNGLYIVARLILPQKTPEKCQKGAIALQRNAFRALRFFFSMERNRKMFKRLFPPELFQKFIDIGHYIRKTEAYQSLVDLFNSMEDDRVDEIRESIEELNQNKTPKRYIRDYAIYDILGTGAFGSVYRVKKRSKQTPLALKEVSVAGGGGRKGTERQKREIDEIVRELSIIREQLRHPNIVRYYSTFKEDDKLYIEMELIEGASLQEHFTSLKEKKEKGMGETRLWGVFIQICLALRYLHCDKRIVHRDLTPNNVMLGESDKVTINPKWPLNIPVVSFVLFVVLTPYYSSSDKADFGLAKQKNSSSKMLSTVGTIMYLCPEIVKSEPYNEKADVWAVGCLLYQMAMLDPPFMSNNILTIAHKIVEGRFEPVKSDWGYSSLVQETVKSCLTVEADQRPDIVAISGKISEPLLRYTDQMTSLRLVAEKRVEKERRRTQRQSLEARRNRQDYQTLFQASQESSERSAKTLQLSDGSLTSQGNDAVPTTSRTNSSETDVFASENDSVTAEYSTTDSSALPGSISSANTNNNTSNGLTKGDTPLKPIQTRPVSAGTRQIHPPSPDLRSSVPRRALSFDLTAPRTGDTRSASFNRNTASRDLSRAPFSARGRPSSSTSGSAARMLSISPSKLRPISDPVQQTLIQLHKIIYIDQLPPTSEVNYRRRIISRYKRALFSPNSRSIGLKNELKKLLVGSHETIDLDFIVDASSLANKATQESEARELLGSCYVSTVTEGGKLYEEGITYAQMQTMIERVLQESGYYDFANRKLRSDSITRSRIIPGNLEELT